MGDREICATCLVTDVRMIKFHQVIRNNYLNITGLKDRECDLLPSYVCFLCYAHIKRCYEFKKTCLTSQSVLKSVWSTNGEITKTAINEIDRKSLGLVSTLSATENYKSEFILVKSETLLEDNDPLIPKEIKIEFHDLDDTISNAPLIKKDEEYNEHIVNEPLLNPVLRKTREKRLAANGKRRKTSSRKRNVVPKIIKEEKSFEAEIDLDDEVKDEIYESDFEIEYVKPRKKRIKREVVGVPKEDQFSDKIYIKNFILEVMTPADIKMLMSTKKESTVHCKFKCELCYTGFKKLSAYKSHCNRHKFGVFGELQCDICKMYVRSQREIKNHMIENHMHKLTCKLCGFVTYKRKTAGYHFRKIHNKKAYKCDICVKEFNNIHSKGKHMKDYHSTLPCELCGECFVKDNGLNLHKKLRHGVQHTPKTEVDKESPFYCKLCEIQFSDGAALDRHIVQSSLHTDEEAEVIVKKKPRGPTRKSLKTALLNPNVQIDFHCKMCNLVLPSNKQLQHHYKTVHPGERVPAQYMCDECGKTLMSENNLRTHKYTHTKEKPFNCPVCNKAFACRANRARHVKQIHGEKTLHCDKCDYKTAMQYDMKIHIKTVHLKIPHLPRVRAEQKRIRDRRSKKMMQTCEELGNFLCI